MRSPICLLFQPIFLIPYYFLLSTRSDSRLTSIRCWLTFLSLSFLLCKVGCYGTYIHTAVRGFVCWFWLCWEACGILVSWPGRTLALCSGSAETLPTGPPGKFVNWEFLSETICMKHGAHRLTPSGYPHVIQHLDFRVGRGRRVPRGGFRGQL